MIEKLKLDSKLKLRLTDILVNDDSVYKDPMTICVGLNISNEVKCSIEAQLKRGQMDMREAIRLVLNEWHARNGNKATVDTLVKVLQEGRFQSAADLIEDNILRKDLSPLQMRQDAKSPNPVKVSSHGQEHNLTLHHRLDYGTFGDIYKASHTFDGREFALKRISVGKFITEMSKSSSWTLNQTEFNFEKLFREIKVMARVQKCPYFVTYYDYWFEGLLEEEYRPMLARNRMSIPLQLDVKGIPLINKGQDDTFFCIQMEFCATDLEVWMDENPFPERKRSLKSVIEAVIIKQCLQGLVYMHSLDIFHRNLTPKNIFVTYVGNDVLIKIGDLGLAREIPINCSTLTERVGIPDFRSPEMERGDTNYDEKTDIFSLGLIYLTLVHSFVPNDKKQVKSFVELRRGDLEVTGVINQVENTYSPSPGCPRTFATMRRMLTRNKNERPSAEVALKLLQDELMSN